MTAHGEQGDYSFLRVTADGRCSFLGKIYRCALGRTGIIVDKREGDGGTPAGVWEFGDVLYRPDRIAPPQCMLPVKPILPSDGWCDDPLKPEYNRPVTLPYSGSHERMWRSDALYDLLVVVAYNSSPPVSEKGSAIFVHVASDDYASTAGCIAFAMVDLVEIVAGLDRSSRLVIETG